MPNELHNAAKDPSIVGLNKVKKLIREGADVNERHSQYTTTPVAFAVQSGSLLTLEALVRANASLDASKDERNLFLYALFNRPEVIEYLSKPHIYTKFNDGTTDLHAAALAGRVDEVKAILDQDPNRIKEKSLHGASALYWAVLARQEEVVQCIINHPAYQTLSKDEIDENARNISNGLNDIANHYFDIHQTAYAISLYELAVQYRNSVNTKSESDSKNLVTYYTNLGGAYIYQHTKESDEQAITKAVEAYQKSKAEVEKVSMNDDDYPKLERECRYGLLTIDSLFQGHAMKEQKRAYHRPEAAAGSVVSGGTYQYKNYVPVVNGANPSTSHRKKSGGGGFSLFTGFMDGLNRPYASYPKAPSQEDIEFDKVLEESRKQAEAEQELKEVAAKLRSVSDGFGFDLAPQVGDGNCLFYTIAHQLNAQGIERWKGVTDEQLRIMAINHLDKYEAYYRQFTAYDEDRHEDQETKSLGKNRNWANHYAIQALSRELNVNLFIVQVDRRPRLNAASGKKEVNSNIHVIRQENATATLYLAYIFGFHYDSLVPKIGHFNDFKPNESAQKLLDREHVDNFWKEIAAMPPVAVANPAAAAPIPVTAEALLIDELKIEPLLSPIPVPTGQAPDDIEMIDLTSETEAKAARPGM